MTTTCKELKQPKNFFNAHKKHSKNKKIMLQNKFIFTTEQMLQIIKESKLINVTKNIQKKPQKCPIQTVLENNKNNIQHHADPSHHLDPSHHFPQPPPKVLNFETL